MDFQLNPDAAEFIPVSPQILGTKMNLVEDFPISGSPLKQISPMDDIQIPSQSEFEEEVCQRPREIEAEEKECANGDYLQRTDYKDFMADRQKGASVPGNLDDSEISSTKAEFGDESASFLTATEFHRTGISAVDESFCSSERDYDIAKDPMAMSFTPSDFEAVFDKGVDLNAVHDLSTVDSDDKNGTVEDKNDTIEDENNDTVEEQVIMMMQSEMQSELISSESKQPEPELHVEPEPAQAPVFQDEGPVDMHTSLSQQYEGSEFTFGEHPVEQKTVELRDTQSEDTTPQIEQSEQQDAVKSEHSPLTDNYSTEFESEKEPASIDNEQLLSPCSADIEETKPIDEPSEDAVLPTMDSQKDTCLKEADTPLTISPVPDAMECSSPQKENELISLMDSTQVSSTQVVSNLHPDIEEFKPRQQCTFGAYSAEPISTTFAVEAPGNLEEDTGHVPVEEANEVVSQAASSTEAIAEEKIQENLLDFTVEQEERAKTPVADMEGEPTPPPSPQDSDEKITQNINESVCPVEPSVTMEDTSPVKIEENHEKVEVHELETQKEAPLVEIRESEVTPAPATLNLSESMQEFTGLEKQLQPEDVTPVQQQVPEIETKDVKEEIVEQKEITEPVIEEIQQVQEEKIIPQVTLEEKQPEEKETKVEEPEKKVEEPTVVPIAVAAVAAAAATATVAAAAGTGAAQSKTKAKPAVKSTKSLASTKSTPKSTPTSPSKQVTATSRTSTGAAKKPATSSASRPKELDATKKTSVSNTTAAKAPITKSTAAPKTTTTTAKTTTRTSVGAAKPKSATASPKPNVSATDKKPTANGDVKPLSKPSAARSLTKPTTTSTATKSSLAKTSTTTRTSTSASTAKPRPTSAATSTKASTTKAPTTTTSTTTGASGTTRPKTAPATSTTAKPRVTTTAKSPMIDKQIKETANKQISLARTATSTATKTTRTSLSATSTSTTAKRTSTSKTTTATSSPTKKITATSKLSTKTTVKSTSSSGKMKVVQNGVSENMEITSTIITTTNSKLEDDMPKKDLSPVVAPSDNQLIMSSD